MITEQVSTEYLILLVVYLVIGLSLGFASVRLWLSDNDYIERKINEDEAAGCVIVVVALGTILIYTFLWPVLLLSQIFTRFK